MDERTGICIWYKCIVWVYSLYMAGRFSVKAPMLMLVNCNSYIHTQMMRGFCMLFYAYIIFWFLFDLVSNEKKKKNLKIIHLHNKLLEWPQSRGKCSVSLCVYRKFIFRISPAVIKAAVAVEKKRFVHGCGAEVRQTPEHNGMANGKLKVFCKGRQRRWIRLGSR